MKFNFDFINNRRWWYAISLLLIVPGLIAMALNRPVLNFGIDFTGGNIIQLKFEQEIDALQIREVLAEFNLDGSPIQAAGNNEYIIRTAEINEEQTGKVINAFKEKLGSMEVLRNQKVGATIGRELTIKGAQAMLIAWVLMIIYITFRFEFLFGVSAVLALIQNVLITIGIFAIFRWEVDTTFLAAILTIIGYSINDTIVIFDRIRENMRLRRKETVVQLVNRSINQNLTRSINTSATTALVLLALMFLGGVTTKIFALAMLIGVVVGTYSSIFTACPLWIDLNSLKRRHRKSAAGRV